MICTNSFTVCAELGAPRAVGDNQHEENLAAAGVEQ